MKTTKNTRYGKALVKLRKTDPEFREVLVEEENGHRYYYHPQLSDWFSLPREWEDRIIWND